ncbi:MAG: alpha/beta hydrolase [Gammaproteobacteria bacterium]|nr:alpha/beta hydrolase [Gammaproteobacteria bacterium]
MILSRRLITHLLPALVLSFPVSAASRLFTDIDTPPGIKIWHGNHNNHIFCTGSGSPTVVLESGLGGNSLDWVLVQPEIARFTRVCSYDRAGYGWSDSGNLPRSIPRLAAELEILLRLAGETPPYILTGHSFGGLINQFFAASYRDKVVGMVLVDSSNTEQFERLENDRRTARLTPTSPSFILYNSTSIPEAIPNEYKPLARLLATKRKSVRALYSELRNFRRSVDELKGLDASRADIPVKVISRGVIPPAGSSLSNDQVGKREVVWKKMQEDLARKNNAALLVSKKPDHYIQLSDPAIVVDAVRSVFNDVRNKGL